MGDRATKAVGTGRIEGERQHRAERAIQLLDQWMADESGYDEQTWPELQAALEQHRLSSRGLFVDE
jgi:hypothetical protein